MRTFCYLLVLSIGLMARTPISAQEPQADLRPKLRDYLLHHQTPPEQYLASLFKDHDIVFVGEFHRIKHDPLLIQAVIPELYQAGVLNLGIEFANYSDQPNIDKLITAPQYDEQLARDIIFNESTYWGFIEYEDLFRAAWQLNHSLKPGKPTFRIVGLNYAPRWELMNRPAGDLTPEERKAVFYNGDGDAYMASVVIKEFVDRSKKALIYSGIHHAFTRYRQPRYDYNARKVRALVNNRMGNIVYGRIGTRAATVFLHSPWQTIEAEGVLRPPAAGVIDEVCSSLKKRLGFSVADSPFGQITDPASYYAAGHEAFKLSDYCDGYVYQMPLDKFEGATVDLHFVTHQNLQRAIDGIANPPARSNFKSPADFVNAMKNDTDIHTRFQKYGVFAPR